MYISQWTQYFIRGPQYVQHARIAYWDQNEEIDLLKIQNSIEKHTGDDIIFLQMQYIARFSTSFAVEINTLGQ